jgi:hypothetical protein
MKELNLLSISMKKYSEMITMNEQSSAIIAITMMVLAEMDDF